MLKNIHFSGIIAICALLITGFQQEEETYEPIALFLTWQNDPTTTMTIDWHTKPDTRPLPPSLQYKEKGSGENWKKAPGTMHPFPYTSRTVNRVELSGLKPGTTYKFRIGPPASVYFFPQSQTYSFRTMPDRLDEPLRFAVGGDTGWSDGFRSVADAAMAYDLEFIVIGGDLAYADGGARDWRTRDGEFRFPENESKRRWVSWFNVVQDKLITEDKRVIPMLTGIGNHEVWRGLISNHPEYEQTDEWRERLAPVYYNIFAFPGQPGYAVLDFADYLSFILLDSDHTNPIEGKQALWLDQVLAERTEILHVFPIYHIASYPTVRDYDGLQQEAIRTHWGSLFEQYNLNVVFENHDHTYKRTYPIRNGEIDPTGVVYMGDGAFGLGGRGDRMHDIEETWYLRHAAPDKHFILVTVDSEGSLFEAINKDGIIIDRFPED